MIEGGSELLSQLWTHSLLQLPPHLSSVLAGFQHNELLVPWAANLASILTLWISRSSSRRKVLHTCLSVQPEIRSKSHSDQPFNRTLFLSIFLAIPVCFGAVYTYHFAVWTGSQKVRTVNMTRDKFDWTFNLMGSTEHFILLKFPMETWFPF